VDRGKFTFTFTCITVIRPWYLNITLETTLYQGARWHWLKLSFGVRGTICEMNDHLVICISKYILRIIEAYWKQGGGVGASFVIRKLLSG
jgi:hypothetical protein